MTSSAAAWILTGMSGAGKATAAAALSRAGAAVHDNLPVALLVSWAASAREDAAVAIVDARQSGAIRDLVPPEGVRVLFLDAADSVLLRRSAESTAPHPGAVAGGGLAAVRTERGLLTALRAAADTVIDSSESTPADLGRRVVDTVLGAGSTPASMHLNLSSFGYKFGIQREADWVVDVRFLRNPFWDPELRPRTGLEERVQRYVLDDSASGEFVGRLVSLLRWLLGEYAAHNRGHLHVAFGCTGGRHRSVAIAEEMGRRLEDEAVAVRIRHRDVEKPDPR
ncbi:MAG: RNase adapter RapZ [Candidatus Dormibacteria bacterium]